MRNLAKIAVGMAFIATAFSSAQAEDNINISLGSFGYLYTGVMTADTMGFFKQQGFQTDIQNVQSGTKAVAAIVSDNAQFTVTAPQSAFRARGEGTDLIVVGAAITQLASNVVVTKDWAQKHSITETSSYQDRLKAMKGGNFGITTPGSGTDQLIRFLAKQAGLNNIDEDLTIVPLQNAAAMPPALSVGRIDGFTTSPPMPETAMKEFEAVKLFDLVGGKVEALNGFFYQGIVVREEFAKKNPEIVIRFLMAMQQAMDAIRDPSTSDKIRDAVRTKYFGQTDPKLFAEIWQQFKAAFPKDIQLTKSQVVRVTDFVSQFEKPIPASAIETGWTNDYAAEAVKRLSK